MNHLIKFRAFQDNRMITHSKAGVYGVARLLAVLYEDTELMQFTGLFDKNGVEIYEGDIVRWSVNDVEPVGHVFYDAPSFDLHTNINTAEVGLVCWDPLRGESEVLGNIHANPELLK